MYQVKSTQILHPKHSETSSVELSSWTIIWHYGGTQNQKQHIFKISVANSDFGEIRTRDNQVTDQGPNQHTKNTFILFRGKNHCI